jgi:phage repressor protein C with HTH and peptisase S24 domain
MQNYSLHHAAMEIHDRLKLARKRKFGSAAAAAEYLGIPYGTYSGHESGARGIKRPEIERYAKVFRVPVAWLAHEQGTISENPNVTPIVGLAGAGANGSVKFGDAPGQLGEAPLAPGSTAETVALEVRGESMPGIANDGWLIYYDDRREPPSEEMFGELCVVALKSGDVLVKFLHQGTKRGRYHLESTGAATMRDQVVQWAALVTAIIPRKQARKLRKTG